MKTTLLTLLMLVNILGCNARKDYNSEEKIRTEINAEFKKNMLQCGTSVNAVTDFNGKTELWGICELENGNRILKIESHEDEVYYQEIYFEKEGDLIYARETANYLPKNHFTQRGWNCEFYTKNGKILTITSLGHGKTEDEEWEPESIFEMYKKRLAELEKIEE